MSEQQAPIAVIGYSYRLPGGMKKDEDFWKLLSERGFVQEPIENRYGKGECAWDGFTDSPSRVACPFEGLITDEDELKFDCALFGMSPNDAKRLDPQIKMMLCATWEALERAGLDQAALHNTNTGVFTGQQVSSIAGWRPPFGATAGDVPGKSGSMIANRISFHFNWMGPSFSVATACSSGITALDAAVKSLGTGECDLAAFGAVNYLGQEVSSVGFNQLGIISKTGTSRSFDKDANGYMRAEGAFMFILKRLDDAEAAGDNIFGVIRGCGLNTAGAELDADVLTQGRMIVAPTGHAQQKLMQQVSRQAGVDPLDVDYVEAHATGTAVGDAVEGNAIGAAYGSPTRSEILRLASSRSNVGHMEAASFTCSLLKVLLMLERRVFLPVSSHFKSGTPKVAFETRRMRVQTACEPFPEERNVLVGINSFGFGGANGHCIIEEYRPQANQWSQMVPQPVANPVPQKVFSVPLSAKGEEALVESARRLSESLDGLDEHVDAYTLIANLSCRRTQHRVRTAFTATSLPDLKKELEGFVTRADAGQLKGDEVTRINLKIAAPEADADPEDDGCKIARPITVMVFPGQGSQWAGCGRMLYETEDVFRRVVDLIDEQWVHFTGQKLSTVAFDEQVGAGLNDCINAQPVTFLLQVSLFELLKTHGVYADAVIGHSAGEASAAYASGAYTLEEACRLVYERSRLQDSLAGCGRMLVLMLDRATVEETLTRLNFSFTPGDESTEGDVVDIACENSPGNTVICGAPDVIERLRAKMAEDGGHNGKLIPGNIAFHSRHMKPIQKELYASLAPLDAAGHRSGPVPWISTVTGKVLSTVNAEYWWSNVRQPVKLLDSMRTIRRLIRPDVLVEISPHITLRSPIRDCYADDDSAMPPYVHTLIRGANTAECFAKSLGHLFKEGVLIDYKALYPRPRPMTHILPTYAMKQERMMDNLIDAQAHLRLETFSHGPVLGTCRQGSKLQFQALFSKMHFSWMTDHVVQETALVPASGYVELLLEAFKGESIHIVSARFLNPFTLTGDAKYMHTDIEPVSYAPNRFEFSITSRPHADLDVASTVHCTGVLVRLSDGMADAAIPVTVPSEFPTSLEALGGRYSECMYADSKSLYETMAARVGEAFSYGPYFRVIKRVDRDVDTLNLRCEIELDATLWSNWDKMGYVLHPTMLDGVLQIFIVYVMETPDFSGVPQMINDFVFVTKPTSEKLICVYEPPEYLKGNVHHKGQLAFALGERPAGAINMYDGVTGKLVAYLGRYTSFHANAKKPDLRKTKHFLSWQPKDGCKAEEVAASAVATLRSGGTVGGTTATLIQGLIAKGHPVPNVPFFVNIGECIIGALPERLALEDCVEVITDAPVQYTLLGPDTELLTEQYNRFGTSNKDAHLRFIERKAGSDGSAGGSFLRPAMFELLVLRHTADGKDMAADDFASLVKLVAPGGLLLLQSGVAIGHQADGEDEIDFSKMLAKWSCLYSQGGEAEVCTLLLRAPGLDGVGKPFPAAGSPATLVDGQDVASCVVVDDALGYADTWRTAMDSSAELSAQTPAPECNGHANNGASAPSSGKPGGSVDFGEAQRWSRIDFFAALRGDDDDATELHDAPAELTEWVKQFSSQRNGVASVTPCIFTVYTSGAVRKVTSPSQTGVWGAVRAMALELGDACKVDFRLIDLGCKADLAHVPAITAMREREMCVHNGSVWTSRLINHREAMPVANLSAKDPCAFRLHTDNSGAIADLQFRTLPLPPLGDNDVEIEVKGAALNFRDIMVGLGRLPLQSFERSALGRTVGIECAGEVVRCGKSVKRHRVGGRVLAMQGGCIANRLRCHELAAFAMPSALTYAEGSSLLSVYVTAYYSLIYLARMRKGTTILVHSAMGGVGQAAIALAKHTGALVYGTAGSDTKRDKLLEMGCVGAFNSHSTEWFSDVMKATDGRGIDIVLNSLAGEHVDLCLEALAPGGWHCEIGKVDIYADRPMKMAVFRKNLAYRAVDIDRLMMDDPQLAAYLTDQCLELLQTGKVPTLPISVYTYADHQAALRCMMNGQHQGKIVLTPPLDGDTISVGDTRLLYGTGSDGTARTVVLSGCLGDFGLRVFAYVIALGAKHILMFDRDAKRRRSVEWLRNQSYVNFLMPDSADVRIEIVRADVSVYSDVVDAVAAVKSLSMPPIGSVFHLAGILDDKFIGEMTRDSFANVYAPKANGAWNLHRATLGCEEIAHFVMLSSTSSAFGNPGQINYSAANSYQDGLAEMRKQMGKPALSYCMGAVIEAGMAARNPHLLQMMKAGGMPAISCIFAIEVLDSALRAGTHSNAVAALATRFAADLDSTDFLRSAAQLVQNSAAFKLGGGGAMSKDALILCISAKVAALCGVDEVGPAEPLSSYGLNSISVAELGAFLKQEMSYTASAMQLMTSATCESIANGILSASGNDSSGSSAPAGGADATAMSDAAEGADAGASAWQLPRGARIPSRFAPMVEVHFPQGTPTRFSSSQSKPKPHIDTRLTRDTRSDAKKHAPVVAAPLQPTLGHIDGSLPPKCQEALDELLGFVHSLDVSALPPVVPVHDARIVLLTGATGFLGRHFLAKLLDRTDVHFEMVYCPVRAADDGAALGRVITAMEASGTWKESFRTRIHPFAGNLEDRQFGASDELFQTLLETVDLVYHFASNLKLAASFDELRQTNCNAMLPVLKLCLTHRKKHLFLASTLGIFPQYFCQFGNEFAERRVSQDAMPEIAVMKRIYPLYIGGYPWSKLVVELAAYEAMRAKGLTLAVFRLPYLYSSSSTGYTVTEDPMIRLFQAVLQTRKFPGRYRPFAVEDADVINAIMLNVSLNPRRKHTVYHCSRQSKTVMSECNVVDMMGFHCKSISYQSFKAECQKLGAASPLHTFWALIDHYAPYWIERTCEAKVWPIDDATVRADCVPLPAEPNAIDVTRATFEWAYTHPELWPFDIKAMHASLDADSMLGTARELCASYGLNFQEAVPPYVVDGLRRICNELEERGVVLEAARPSIAFNMQSKLETRVHLHKLFLLHPEIADEPIEAPVFILGLNRTGTTFLHRMLEASGCFNAPHVEDQNLLPRAEQLSSPDAAVTEERLDFFRSMLVAVSESFSGIHEMAMGKAEEDMCAHSHAFASLEYDIMYGLPRYREWLDQQPLFEVYEEHRRWMQFIAWSRRRANGGAAKRWVFKLPWHVRSLPALLKVYPDAVLVHTHRMPQDVAGSWCSLVERQRERFVGEVDRAELGSNQLELLGKMLLAGTHFRASDAFAAVAPRWLDVHFTKLIASPEEVAAQVIAHAGLRFDHTARKHVQEHLQASRAQRKGASLHSYKSESYALGKGAFATEAFSQYSAALPVAGGWDEPVKRLLGSPTMITLAVAMATAALAAATYESTMM